MRCRERTNKRGCAEAPQQEKVGGEGFNNIENPITLSDQRTRSILGKFRLDRFKKEEYSNWNLQRGEKGLWVTVLEMPALLTSQS